MKYYHGISVTPGIAIGLVSIVSNDALDVTRTGITRPSVPAEFSRLDLAFEGASDSLAASCEEVSSQLGRQFGQIFEAHSLILSDPKTREKIKKIIETQLVCAEYAVASVFEDNAKKIRALKNPVFAERASDIIDVRDRVLRYLNNVDETEEDVDDNRQYVVVGSAINPSRAAKLSSERTAAIVTETGGLGSHTAIVAAALGVPTVLGVGPFIAESNLLNRKSLVIVDGTEGLLIIDPDLETVQRYEEKQKVLQERQRRLEAFRKTGKAVSLDGVEVEIKGNIEFPHEAELCVKNGACGVGLYRTEFLYLTAPKGTLPDEEAHFEAYKTVLQTVGKEYPTVIRTFDLGADKDPGFENIHEDNPFMGLRSIRLSLRHTPMFRTQLRAILRASVYGKAKVMFPLVSTISEWLYAKAIFKEVCDDLAEEGIPFDHDIPLGVMVETPATVVMLDQFVAEDVKFFSLGTNDLLQYTMAVDRSNERVQSLYAQESPPLLRLIQHTVEVANRYEKEVSLCGQMGSMPACIPLLLGLGLRSISVSPGMIPQMKNICASFSIEKCKEIAREALNCKTALDVRSYLRREYRAVMGNSI